MTGYVPFIPDRNHPIGQKPVRKIIGDADNGCVLSDNFSHCEEVSEVTRNSQREESRQFSEIPAVASMS